MFGAKSTELVLGTHNIPKKSEKQHRQVPMHIKRKHMQVAVSKGRGLNS